jgi:hypothetical protein
MLSTLSSSHTGIEKMECRLLLKKDSRLEALDLLLRKIERSSSFDNLSGPEKINFCLNESNSDNNYPPN